MYSTDFGYAFAPLNRIGILLIALNLYLFIHALHVYILSMALYVCCTCMYSQLLSFLLHEYVIHAYMMAATPGL